LALLLDAHRGYAFKRASHGGGVGDGRHSCDVDRGYGAAAALRPQRQVELELD
jgi:hypothetical protein